MIPAIRNDSMMQENVSRIDMKDAAVMNNLTSPAAIPLKRYTGSKIANVNVIAVIAASKDSAPPRAAVMIPTKNPGINQKL